MTTITAFIPYLTKGDFSPTELKKKVKEKEFNLSEHLEYATTPNLSWGDMVIRERYIKEFIKELKDSAFSYGGDSFIMLEDFNKLVGDKLLREIEG